MNRYFVAFLLALVSFMAYRYNERHYDYKEACEKKWGGEYQVFRGSQICADTKSSLRY